MVKKNSSWFYQRGLKILASHFALQSRKCIFKDLHVFLVASMLGLRRSTIGYMVSLSIGILHHHNLGLNSQSLMYFCLSLIKQHRRIQIKSSNYIVVYYLMQANQLSTIITPRMQINIISTITPLILINAIVDIS